MDLQRSGFMSQNSHSTTTPIVETKSLSPYERVQMFSCIFSELISDIAEVKLSVSAEFVNEGVGLLLESGVWAYVDIHGTQLITVGIHFEAGVFEKLTSVMADTKDLGKQDRITMFDDIMKEIINTCSGKLLPSLRGESAILSLRSPGVIHGRVNLPKAPYTILEKTTVVGKLNFIIIVDAAKQDLERMYRKLRNLDNAKSAFISTMSHELRTPLNAVIGFSSILRGRTSSNDALHSLATSIHDSGTNLLDLINNILDIARIDTGKIIIQKSKINLAALINDTIFQTSCLAKGKNIELYAGHLFLENAYIEGDATRVNQVLINIISNAVKFTAKGSVVISLCKQEVNNTERYVVDIKDTGIGLSEDDVQMVFDRFSQVDSSVSRRYEGAGLGLALSKELMQLHSGWIEVASTLGQGCTFSLYFPLPKPPKLNDNKQA